MTQQLNTFEINILKPDHSVIPQEFIEIYENAYNLLLQGNTCLAESNWLSCVALCKEFIQVFEFTSHSENKADIGVKNYRFIASAFIAHNYTLENITSLKNLQIDMLTLCEAIFHVPTKKGITAAAPIIKRNDAFFIYSFCAGLYNSILEKI